jgi:uncharacterized protein YaaN involved in tellurite resistance
MSSAEFQLDPPTAAPSASLDLHAPSPVQVVQPAQAEHAVPIDPAKVEQLDKLASDFFVDLTTMDTKSPEFTAKVDAIRHLGDRDIRQTASMSNRLLEKPMAQLRQGGSAAGAKVATDLLSLRETLEDLEPNRQGGGLLRAILDKLPFIDEAEGYFRRYEGAQEQLDAILKSLYQGKDELLRDNVAIEQERANLWEGMQRLQQYIYVAGKLDEGIAAQVEQLRVIDLERAKVLENDLLFYVRQRRQDLLTQLAVSVQGYLALDLIKKNNIELVKGVDRATTTTIAALRTAVIVAQALSDQQLVLDQISALSTTTSSLIASTSQMLRGQTEQVHEQAVNAGVDMQVLEQAFNDVFATMDSIDQFKGNALQSMQETVEGLQGQLDQAQGRLERSHSGAPTAVGVGAGSDELTIT